MEVGVSGSRTAKELEQEIEDGRGEGVEEGGREGWVEGGVVERGRGPGREEEDVAGKREAEAEAW